LTPRGDTGVQVGNSVEVWSEGDNAWVPATVIMRNETANFVTVKYTKAVGETEKNIPFENMQEFIRERSKALNRSKSSYTAGSLDGDTLPADVELAAPRGIVYYLTCGLLDHPTWLLEALRVCLFVLVFGATQFLASPFCWTYYFWYNIACIVVIIAFMFTWFSSWVYILPVYAAAMSLPPFYRKENADHHARHIVNAMKTQAEWDKVETHAEAYGDVSLMYPEPA